MDEEHRRTTAHVQDAPYTPGFTLDWTGDVFVIGYPEDLQGVGENQGTGNLAYLSKADWNIAGNLLVLSSGQTEAARELGGTPEVPSTLEVTGTVLIMGEATAHEAELDLENYSSIEVRGLLGLYATVSGGDTLALEVGRADVEDQAHVGAGDVGEQANLPVRGGAHLDDCRGAVLGGGEQRQRPAGFEVRTLLRGGALTLTPLRDLFLAGRANSTEILLSFRLIALFPVGQSHQDQCVSRGFRGGMLLLARQQRAELSRQFLV